jgi:hypothetical protein
VKMLGTTFTTIKLMPTNVEIEHDYQRFKRVDMKKPPNLTRFCGNGL